MGIDLVPDTLQQPFHGLLMPLELGGMFFSPVWCEKTVQLKYIVVDVARRKESPIPP